MPSLTYTMLWVRGEIDAITAADPDAVSSNDALAFTTTSHVDRVSPDALDLTCDWYQEHADILEAYTDLDRDYVPIHTLRERWTYDE